MKRTTVMQRIAIVILLVMSGSATCWAQGIEVRTKDGEVARYRYHDIESIVPYDSEMPYLCQAVDLGLSVCWASCNIGAASEEDYGRYYAWGETATKREYTASSNPLYAIDYAVLQAQGIVDADGTLSAERDVANIIWGDNWRMPTAAEQRELLENCEWAWERVGEVGGYRVTGPNGNSIFLPASGYRRGGEVFGCGDVGYLWSSTAHNDYGGACSLFFHQGERQWNDDARYYGHPVRPVIESSHLSETDGECRSVR